MKTYAQSSLSLQYTPISTKAFPLNLGLVYEYGKEVSFDAELGIRSSFIRDDYNSPIGLGYYPYLILTGKYNFFKNLYVGLALINQYDLFTSRLDHFYSSDGLYPEKVFPYQVYVSPRLIYKKFINRRRSLYFKSLIGYPIQIGNNDIEGSTTSLFEKEGTEFDLTLGFTF